MPIFTVAGSSFSYLRRVQHGELQLYMLYIFATLFVLMICGHW
jgi:hydrogenase-4 component B